MANYRDHPQLELLLKILDQTLSDRVNVVPSTIDHRREGLEILREELERKGSGMKPRGSEKLVDGNKSEQQQ